MKKQLIAVAILAMAALPVAAQNYADSQSQEQKRLQALEYRVQELERKVAGMQKQITVLHSKKADKNLDSAAK